MSESKNALDSLIEYGNLMNSNVNSNFERVLLFYNKAMLLEKRANSPYHLAIIKEYLANAYWYSNNFEKAMMYYLEELRIGDSIKNKILIGSSKYNIGWIKAIQLKQKEHVKYFYDALKIFEIEKDTSYLLQLYDALGNYYKLNLTNSKSYEDSIYKYFNRCIKIVESSTYKINQGGAYSNMAYYYVMKKDILSAHTFLYKALASLKNDDYYDEYFFVTSKANLIFTLGSLDSLAKMKSVEVELESFWKNPINEPLRLVMYENLYEVYKSKRKFELALNYLSKFKNLSDSINEKTFNSNLLNKENEYILGKKDKELNEFHLKSLVYAEKNKKNKLAIAILFVLIFAVLIGLFFLLRGYKAKQKTNNKLSEQNKIISLKKLEIEQSIEYAKGIQDAVLPNISDLNTFFNQNAILYLPKDVVSGDFYWYHIINENEILLACADCTGHGVPGCLMSIVSIDKLNSALFEKKITEPNLILFEINNQIKKSLKQKKDGLDIAIVHFNKKTRFLKYAGANRPLWLIRNDELIEQKATKTSIAGHTPLDTIFQQQEFNLQSNDVILLSSDGYADQFGGDKIPNGKKMTTSKFKSSVIQLATLPMNTVKSELEQNFQQWKGKFEQVDDVCVVIFRV